VHVHTPILTGSDCEGAGEVFTLSDRGRPSPPTLPQSGDSPSNSLSTSTFSSSTSASSDSSKSGPSRPKVDTPSLHSRNEAFFPHPVNLIVSSQLHLECPTHALARTYTLSPAFRAEPSLTSRHLSEFYMLEAEVGFIEKLDQLLDIVEEGIKATLRKLLQGNNLRHVGMRRDLSEEGIGRLDREDLAVASIKPFTRITYTHAIELLESHPEASRSFTHEQKWGHSLSSEHEKWLANRLDGPVFVTHYPKTLKPFYMLPSADGRTVECFDLLLPGLGELAGGSLREHRLPQLSEAISEAGLDAEAYQWYLDLRRYGSIPHGGWGMGWDRWVCWVTGVGNVRDVVPFPRWRGHCKY